MTEPLQHACVASTAVATAVYETRGMDKMNTKLEVLGPAVGWHVRSIPERIRDHFVDAAAAQKITVAQHLTQLATQTPSTAVSPPVDADRLHRLLESAALLKASAAELPWGVYSRARQIIVSELDQIRTAQAGWLTRLPPRLTSEVEDDPKPGKGDREGGGPSRQGVGHAAGK